MISHQGCVSLELLQIGELDCNLGVLGLAVCHPHLPSILFSRVPQLSPHMKFVEAAIYQVGLFRQ